MPRFLTTADVADFRERLCEAAARLFAEKGRDAVTMRQLASELGVSAMTPYRYFRDKDEILAVVRASAFNGFAEALEQARAGAEGARNKAAAVGEAYISFALDNPNTYKLMFDLHQPNEASYPDLQTARDRAGKRMTTWVGDLIEAGQIAGDPERIGTMFWAAAHGAIVLELAGALPSGSSRDLRRALLSTLARGLRPPPADA